MKSAISSTSSLFFLVTVGVTVAPVGCTDQRTQTTVGADGGGDPNAAGEDAGAGAGGENGSEAGVGDAPVLGNGGTGNVPPQTCPLDQQICNATGTAVVKCNGTDYSTVVSDCAKVTPANADTLCSASSCGYKCKPGFLECGDGTCRLECPGVTIIRKIFPRDTNTDGRVIVGFERQWAVRWDQSTGTVTTLRVGSSDNSHAARVSPDGTLVAGWTSLDSGDQPLALWSGFIGSAFSGETGTFEPVGLEGDAGTHVYRVDRLSGLVERCSVSSRSCVALEGVSTSRPTRFEGVSVDGSVYAWSYSDDSNSCSQTNKGKPPAPQSGACLQGSILSGNGKYLFGYTDAGTFRWRIGADTLEVLEGMEPVVDTSDDGTVAVSYGGVWKEGKGVTKFEALRDSLTMATIESMSGLLVSRDGRVVVGSGADSSFDEVTWRIVLP
ncbi:MAG: hypothetical protein KA712_19675 [Myxococcales bacterium]|nr:hypothetical protein [Myxococcales bacterium]